MGLRWFNSIAAGPLPNEHRYLYLILLQSNRILSLVQIDFSFILETKLRKENSQLFKGFVFLEHKQKLSSLLPAIIALSSCFRFLSLISCWSNFFCFCLFQSIKAFGFNWTWFLIVVLDILCVMSCFQVSITTHGQMELVLCLPKWKIAINP